MAQPAEGMQLARPVVARRLEGEHRRAGGVDGKAGEDEAPGIDVVGERGVAGAEVGRRNQEPVRRRAVVAGPVDEAAVVTERCATEALAQGEGHEAPSHRGRYSH